MLISERDRCGRRLIVWLERFRYSPRPNLLTDQERSRCKFEWNRETREHNAVKETQNGQKAEPAAEQTLIKKINSFWDKDGPVKEY